MSGPFSILEVTSSMRSDVEQLGSKPKFWFTYQAENWLFKEARVNSGEDWAEVATKGTKNTKNENSSVYSVPFVANSLCCSDCPHIIRSLLSGKGSGAAP